MNIQYFVANIKLTKKSKNQNEKLKMLKSVSEKCYQILDVRTHQTFNKIAIIWLLDSFESQFKEPKLFDFQMCP